MKVLSRGVGGADDVTEEAVETDYSAEDVSVGIQK